MRTISDYSQRLLPAAEEPGIDPDTPDNGRPPTPRRTEPVLVVVGTAGGVGTSTLAALLACQAARSGGQAGVTLVGADPDSGGLDMILGLEEEPGLRWQDIRAPLGVVDATTLAARLPAADGVRVLAGRPWSGHAPRPWEQDAVFDALMGLPGPLVIDAGQGTRLPDRLAHFLGHSCGQAQDGAVTVLLLTAPCLAALAAGRMLAEDCRRALPGARIATVVSRIGPVVPGWSSPAPDDGQIADALGVPVIGRYRRFPRLTDQIEAGVGLWQVPRGLLRLCDRLVRRAAACPAGGA
jgi:hypothetical protein